MITLECKSLCLRHSAHVGRANATDATDTSMQWHNVMESHGFNVQLCNLWSCLKYSSHGRNQQIWWLVCMRFWYVNCQYICCLQYIIWPPFIRTAHIFIAGEMVLVLTLSTVTLLLNLVVTPSSALTTCPGFPGYCSEAFPGSVKTSTSIWSKSTKAKYYKLNLKTFDVPHVSVLQRCLQ